MSILPANDKNISTAAHLLKSGGLVAFPTETVYGLGADGLNPSAVAMIFAVKNRPAFNPLILHLAGTHEIDKYCEVENEIVYRLAEKFWPGPLTIVLRKKDIVPDIVTSGNPTVAIRMPRHPAARDLIEKAGVPVAAPSANAFGYLSPTEAAHVQKQLGDKVEIILDGGKTTVGIESTIISVTGEGVKLLRHGGLSVEEIEKVTGKLQLAEETSEGETPESPGRLPYHYSPSKTMKIIDGKIPEGIDCSRTGILLFRENSYECNFANVKILSSKGDMLQAAANLFAYLHDLENSNIDLILAERVPEEGLGTAIMDRLKKAAKRYDQ